VTDQPIIRTVELETPVQLGDAPAITSLQLRKPVSGDCRGLSLAKLSQVDVTEVLTLLPRIATPLITPVEAAAIELPDLMAIAEIVADFLLSRAQKATLSQTA